MAGVFHAERGVGRIILIIYSILLALVGLSAFFLAFPGKLVGIGLAVIPDWLFVSGWTAYSWIAVLVFHLTREEA